MNSEQEIQLQSDPGAGIGLYLVNINRSTLSLVGGLVWQRANYQQTVVPALNRSFGSAPIGGKVRLSRLDKTNLTINAFLLPSITESGPVHFNLDTSYCVKL